MVGKTWDMHKCAFHALKRLFCMSQIFPQHILIKKPITLEIVFFLIKLWRGKTWDMHKRAFQALKRAFLHVPHLPPPYFDFKKTIWKVIGFLSKYVGGRPDTCINVRFRPWNAHFACLRSSPNIFWLKNQLP